MTRFITYFYCWVSFFALCLPLYADVKSTDGSIKFDVNNDGVREANMTLAGFAIGKTSPSANLDVGGNGLISDSLGINVTTASANLHVSGNAYISSTLTLDDQLLLSNGSVSAPSLGFQSDTDTGIYLVNTGELGFAISGTQRMLVDSNGGVSLTHGQHGNYDHITLKSPASSGSAIRFKLSGGGTCDYSISVKPAFEGAWAIRDNIVSNYPIFILGNNKGTAYSYVSDFIKLYNSLYAFSNGQIGIGTSSPSAKLHVVGNVIIADGNQAANYVLASDANGLGTWTDVNTLVSASPWTTSNSNIYFSTARIGIGTAAPSANLHVVGTVALSGQTGIGTASPSANLHVSGNTLFTGNIIVDTDNTYDMGSTTKAFKNIYAYTYNIASDRRFKQNIHELEKGLKEISQLKPVSYQYKNDKEQRQRLGLIAQETANIIPEAVSKNNEGYMSINYTELTPILVKAIQEQQALIEKHKRIIEIQKDKLDLQQKALDAFRSDREKQLRVNDEFRQKLDSLIKAQTR